MLAIDYEAAKKVAVGLVGLLVVLSIMSTVIIKNVTTKIVSTLLMVGLALGVWTQRSSLQDCAGRARELAAVDSSSDLTCTFFGSEVTILKADVEE